MFRRALGVCTLIFVAAVMSGFAAGNCPNGTRAAGAGCTLDSDLVLTEPLELLSFTTLNCKGKRILPTSPGTGTTQADYVPSVPAVAIAITGEQGVVVRNCVIGQNGSRFDFGIIAVNSKNAGKSGHQIQNNKIHARDSGITFLRVDDAHVADNVITWTNGYGMFFARDSDRNRFTNNTMSSPGSPAAPIRLVPNGSFRDVVTDDAIAVASFPLFPLYNVVIGDRLYQFPNSEDGYYPGHDDNLIEGNHVSLPGSSVGKSHAGILVIAHAMNSRLIGNTVSGAGVGIRIAGLPQDSSVQRAARCIDPLMHELARFCETNTDCFIPGIDSAPIGTCPALITDVRDLRGFGTIIEGNTLIGPFNSNTPAQRAAIFGGNGNVGEIIRANRIYGTGTEIGILLGRYPIETGYVTGNFVNATSFGLMLQEAGATSFGARVFLNDFTGSTSRAVGVLGPYTLTTNLSWDGVGNYWGHTVPPCFTSADTPIPGLIEDIHPFCVPVAASANAVKR